MKYLSRQTEKDNPAHQLGKYKKTDVGLCPHSDAKLMSKDGSDQTKVGELAPSAASVLMKIMYAARVARFDLLRPVQWLAKFMTK